MYLEGAHYTTHQNQMIFPAKPQCAAHNGAVVIESAIAVAAQFNDSMSLRY